MGIQALRFFAGSMVASRKKRPPANETVSALSPPLNVQSVKRMSSTFAAGKPAIQSTRGLEVLVTCSRATLRTVGGNGPFAPSSSTKSTVRIGLGHAADFHAAPEAIFEDAAALGVGLEPERAIEVRAVHRAVLDEDVAAAAGNFAADDDPAVVVLHRAVE